MNPKRLLLTAGPLLLLGCTASARRTLPSPAVAMQKPSISLGHSSTDSSSPTKQGTGFQAHMNRREPTLYDNENVANRFAVAFWRTQPGGEPFLAELERLATRAAANLPDPTPAGADPIAYFGANYQALGRDPIKYGYYQFRFMRDALRDRAGLDFARMVAGAQGE